MTRTKRILTTLLVLALALSAFVVFAFAEGDAEKTRVEILNEQGYNFVAEGDTEVPKYKLIYPDETEYTSYVATKLKDDIHAAPSGTTVVILADLYQSKTYLVNTLWQTTDADILNDLMACPVANKTINFDFAGHVIFSDYKGVEGRVGITAFFEAEGTEALLNVYSSAPGAALIMLHENQSVSSAVARTASGATINMGDFGEYSGKNLATYSAGGLTLTTGCTINVNGMDMYRVGTDHVSFYNISGKNGSLTFKNSSLFGVGRYLQIATRETAGSANVYGNVITFEDCVISNIGSPGVVGGAFFRYMADDNEIYFKGTVFDTVSFSCEKYFEHDGMTGLGGVELGKQGMVYFDERCSYNQLPDVKSIYSSAESSSKFAMFKFPELAPTYGQYGSTVPEYILADGRITNVYSMELIDEHLTANGIFDYGRHDLLEGWDDLSGMYVLPYLGYEEDVVNITWEFQGQTSKEELWLKGETPTPYTLNVPDSTKYIEYNYECILEQDNIAFYTVNTKINLSLKANMTFSDKMYTNIYIPVYEDLPVEDLVYRLTIGSTVLKASEIVAGSETVTIDGQSYYKVVAPLAYDRITDSINVNLQLPNASKTGGAYSVSKKIDLVSVFNTALDGTGDADYKTAFENIVCYVHKYAQNPAGVTGISGIATTRFSERLDREAAEEAARKEAAENKGFFDKLFG